MQCFYSPQSSCSKSIMEYNINMYSDFTLFSHPKVVYLTKFAVFRDSFYYILAVVALIVVSMSLELNLLCLTHKNVFSIIFQPHSIFYKGPNI